MDNKDEFQPETQIEWFNYLVVILKNKEFIVKTSLAGAFLAAIVSFLIPPTYLAETRILPPQTASSSMATAFASQMGSMGVSALGVKTTNDLYIELLKIRSVSDYVVAKLDLAKYYGGGSKETVRKNLRAGLIVSNDKKSGLITIGYMHRDPKMATDIANAYVEGLQNLNNRLAVTEAATRRLFFEEQLKGAKEGLIRSEEALKKFQQRTGTIKIDDEAKAAIETVARMRASLSAKEVELNVMKSYATPQNPDLQRLQEEISALKSELGRFESKTRSDDDSTPNVGSISSLGTEYLRRMREFKYNESLYEILMKQYGAAKLDESKDAALIQVVETAVIPETRIAPARRKIVMNFAGLSFLGAIALVFIRIYWRSVNADPETNKKVESLKSLLDLRPLARDLWLDKAYCRISGLIIKK